MLQPAKASCVGSKTRGTRVPNLAQQNEGKTRHRTRGLWKDRPHENVSCVLFNTIIFFFVILELSDIIIVTLTRPRVGVISPDG